MCARRDRVTEQFRSPVCEDFPQNHHGVFELLSGSFVNLDSNSLRSCVWSGPRRRRRSWPRPSVSERGGNWRRRRPLRKQSAELKAATRHSAFGLVVGRPGRSGHSIHRPEVNFLVKKLCRFKYSLPFQKSHAIW